MSNGLAQDVRLAFRTLRATPIVSLVAVLSLTLGIGANTAVFSILNSLLVRTLPVAEPQRLVAVSDTRSDQIGSVAGWTYDIWNGIRGRSQAFDGACAVAGERLNLASGGGEAQFVDALWVSGSYFSTLGVPPLLGRTIAAADDVAGATASPPVVLSYRFWQTRFGGDARIVGAPLTIERVPFTIAGVTPPSFFGTEVGRTFDIAVPLAAERLVRGKDSRISPQKLFYGLTVLLRLRADQSPDAATTMLRGVQPQIRIAAMPPNRPPAFQSEFLKDPFTIAPAATGTSGLRSRYERPLIIILAVVWLVLFIACANIANLQLARATARQHELSVRVAIGGSRWRIVRQLLVESVLLSVVGSATGILLATRTAPLLVAQVPYGRSHVFLDLALDWRVLTITGIVAIATTILFGVAPAVRASRVAPIDALKRQPRSASASGAARMSSGLIVAQVALSVLVVAAAGLFVRTFQKLALQPIGYDTDRVLVVTVNTARAQLQGANRYAFVQRLGDRMATLPGVAGTAASLTTPFGIGLVDLVYSPDMTPSEASQPFSAGRLARRASYLNFVTPGWFATYGTTLRAGRDFTDHDTTGAPPVIIVNEAFVKKFLPDANPIGATVLLDRALGHPVEKTVVGVVGNAVYNGARRLDEPTEYAPLAQVDFPIPPTVDASISVRAASGSPMRLARSIAAAISGVDPDLVFGFQLLSDQLGAAIVQERLVAIVSGFFAVVALLLGGLGLYAVTAHAVASRSREIGIRMALGSSPRDIARVVASRIAWLVGGGMAIGVVASVWTARYVAPLLYGITTYDGATYLATIAILAGAAALAASPSVRRAMRIDPIEMLRSE